VTPVSRATCSARSREVRPHPKVVFPPPAHAAVLSVVDPDLGVVWIGEVLRHQQLVLVAHFTVRTRRSDRDRPRRLDVRASAVDVFETAPESAFLVVETNSSRLCRFVATVDDERTLTRPRLQLLSSSASVKSRPKPVERMSNHRRLRRRRSRRYPDAPILPACSGRRGMAGLRGGSDSVRTQGNQPSSSAHRSISRPV
jgi:hypothetical protein